MQKNSDSAPISVRNRRKIHKLEPRRTDGQPARPCGGVGLLCRRGAAAPSSRQSNV
ncbi:MAG: hypothetical protein K2L54_03935 [Clostridiales bacterium]|nr:hypothetical protein [Clostridiales bacterium]